MTQVVGRAGRRTEEGRAVIQTYTPGHPIIQAAAAQDYGAFYRYEIEVRQALLAPPFADAARLWPAARCRKKRTRPPHGWPPPCSSALKALTAMSAKRRCWGPLRRLIQMMNKKYRYQVEFPHQDTTRICQLIMDVLRAFYADRSNRMVSLAADINP